MGNRERFIAVNAVLAARDGNVAAGDLHKVVRRQTLFRRRDGERAALDFQLILGDDSVAGLGGDGKRAAALDREIVLGKERGVHGIVVGLDVFARGGESVLAAGDERENDLFRGDHVKGGAVFAGDGSAVERKDHRFLRCVHDDLPVGERPGHAVAAAGGDRYLVAGDGNARTVGARRAVRERDRNGRFDVLLGLRLGGEKLGLRCCGAAVRGGNTAGCVADAGGLGAAAADERQTERKGEYQRQNLFHGRYPPFFTARSPRRRAV